MDPANYTSHNAGQYVIMEGQTTPLQTTTGGINGTARPEKNWAVLGVIPIVAFVAMGNILVILAVKKDHKLRSSTNYFLTSLAVADLLVAITVMPPSLAMIVNDYAWPFPESLCGIWIMLDVCFSTSSILHLCMISLDRYLALAKPFRYSTRGWMSKNSSGGWGTDKRGNSKWRVGSGLGNNAGNFTKRVAKRIILVWAVSLGIALPLPILGSRDRNNIFYESMCVINIPEFTIYGSLVAFFLPLIVMFITYSLTIRTLQKQSKLVACIMGKDGSTHRGRSSTTSSMTSRRSFKGGSRGSVGSTKSGATKWMSSAGNEESSSLPDLLDSTDNGFAETNYNQSEATGVSGAAHGSLKESKIKTCAAMCCACFGSKRAHSEELNDLTQSYYDEVSRNTLHKSESESSDTSSILNQQPVKRSPMLTRANMRLAKAVSRFPLKRVSTRRISASMKSKAIATEQRASKVLGMIFTLFCLFWCPFFITNAFSGICVCYGLECNQDLMANLMNWFVWVGYVSSGVNPCVYTLFSRQFRETFRKLICCRYSEIGHKAFCRSYPRDMTTGGFSTSSFRPEFQYSMETRDAARSEGLVQTSGTPRPPVASHRTLGKSVVIRQHKRNQVTRSVDTEALLGMSSRRKSVLGDEESPHSQLRWRTTWHYMLEMDDTNDYAKKKNNLPGNGRINSKGKFLEDGMQRHRPRRRLLSEPKLRPHHHDFRSEERDENSVERPLKVKTRRGRSLTSVHSSASRGRRRDSGEEVHERPKFRFGDSSEEEEYNENLNDVFETNKREQIDQNERNISSPSLGARVRFSLQAACRDRGGVGVNVASSSVNNLDGNNVDNFKTEAQSGQNRNCHLPTRRKQQMENEQTEPNYGVHRRPYRVTRLDSGVGESVRNSDSF